jgi:ABC-2 type transport system permease protein
MIRFSRALAVALKELRQMRRDPTTLFVLVLVPAAMLLLFGYALTLDVEHIKLALCDLDRSEASRDLVAAFTRSGAFDLMAEVGAPRGIERLLDAGEVRAGLVIPPGYARDLEGARGAKVQLLLDGADSTAARIAQGYSAVIARERATAVLFETLGAAAPLAAPIEARAFVRFNPELKSARFIVPGLLGILLLVAATMMTAMSVARERERGTLEVLLATPVGRVELVLGKTLPYVFVAFVDLFVGLFVAVFVFGVPLEGSLALLVATTALFLVGALGFGLFLSTIARSQQVAWTLGLLTTLLPSFLLSGFIFPVENMTPAVREFTRLIEARYYIEALRAIALKGAGAADIAPELFALAAFAVLFPALAAARFQKRIGS